MRIQINPELTAYPFDGTGRTAQMVCELPHASGRPVRMLLPKAVYTLLAGYEPAPSPAALIEKLTTHMGSSASERLGKLVQEQLLPKGILVDLDAPGPVSQAKRRDSYLTCKVRLLPPRVVNFCARRLLWLTSPAMVIAMLAAVLLAHLWIYVVVFRGPAPSFATLSGWDLLIVALALTIEILWHEFGHSTALVRFGGKRPEIGWGIYLWYSVFFADLSEAWRMPRRQRVCIDLCGMYFQSMFLLLYAALWAGTHRQVWFHVFYLSDLQLAANFNPFLRMDGYWALLDALGLNSLRSFSVPSVLSDLFGKSHGPFSALPRRMRRVVLGYSVLSLVFYAGVLAVLGLQVRTLWLLYPGTWAAVHEAWLAHAPWMAVAGRVAQLLWRTLLLGLGLAVIGRMALRLLATVNPASLFSHLKVQPGHLSRSEPARSFYA